MCGRFTNRYTWKQLHRLLQLTTPPLEFVERYNIAPTQDAPVVREVAGAGVDGRGAGRSRRVDMLRWGLIPSWAKDESFGSKAINARAETVATSGAFRDSFRRRRCVVPASGFYEWKQLDAADKRKQPYYITPTDEDPFLLAGLWSSWTSSSGPLETFTILTTTPNEMMATLHDRMPVILHVEECGTWLDPTLENGDAVSALLRPYPSELMLAHPVSTLVNSPKNTGKELVQAVPAQGLPPKEEPGLFS